MVMLDDDIMRQLRITFKAEAADHVQAMNRILLGLEKEPNGKERAELLEEIFREAHSLKGAAGAADISDVEATAHKLESVFSAAKDGEIELTADLCDVLYEAIDAVNIIVAATLEDGAHGLDLSNLYARLEAAKEGKVVARTNKKRVAGSKRQGTRSKKQGAGSKKRVTSNEQPASRPTQHATRNTSGIEETIRVATSKLDTLMTQAGELLVAGLKIDQRLKDVEEASRAVEDWNREWLKVRTEYSQLLQDEEHEEIRPLLKFLDLNQQRLKALAARINELRRSFSRDALQLSRVTNDLGEGVMKVRMLPVSTLFDTFPRIVRDLSREKGKEVELVIEGGDTELDRKVLEELKDPLIHILRNCVDHGIELPEKRVKAGKPCQGTVTLRAFQKGNNIVVETTDDGAGINLERVKQAALKAGLIAPEDVETMSDEEAMRLIFAPGLSTSTIITDTSGRGVGMDVVRRNVEALHGHVEVSSTPGQGTTLIIVLPLTLATTQELLVRVADQTYGIPISAVERIQRISPQDISTVAGEEAIVVDDDPVALVHLSRVLELPHHDEESKPEQRMPVVILSAGKRRVAFLVDAMVGQQESVVKSLGKQLARVRNVAGATILGTGQVIMTLNPSDLMKSARLAEGRVSVKPARASQAKVKEIHRPTVLVVDDSLTTRTLEKNILETSGYEVKVANDGTEALNILQSDSCDLVVTDVLMPRMNGFELTAAVRGDPKLKGIPVILVTSLESRADKERGIEVGADAYVVKSSFDQTNLLQTIEQLI